MEKERKQVEYVNMWNAGLDNKEVAACNVIVPKTWNELLNIVYSQKQLYENMLLEHNLNPDEHFGSIGFAYNGTNEILILVVRK